MNIIVVRLKKEFRMLLWGMGMGPRPTNFIGLDIGSRYFRAVRIKKTGDEFLVQDTLTGPIEDIGNLSSKMRVKDEEELCVSFNLEGPIIKRISIPFMPQEEIGSALKWEMKEQAGFDIDNAKIKFKILGEREDEDGAKKIELIAFLFQESDIESNVEHLKDAGLNVQNVMPVNFALAKYVGSLQIVPNTEKAAIVDIGSANATISIVENDSVCFTREIAVGGDNITDAMTGVTVSDKGRMEMSRQEAEKIKIEKGISDDIRIFSLMRPILEKLTTQIKGSLEYYEQHFHEKPVRKIILAGNGSKLKGLERYIVKETGLEILKILPEDSGAIGLAMSRQFSLNMLPERFRSEEKKALKRFSITMVTSILGLAMLFSYILLCIQAINLKKGVDIQRQHWDNLQEIRSLKDKIANYSFVVNAVSDDFISAGRIMKKISNLVLSDIVLDRLTVDNKYPNIIIGGVVSRQGLLTEFMSKLEFDRLLSDVKLSFSERNQGIGQDAVEFEITCNIRK